MAENTTSKSNDRVCWTLALPPGVKVIKDDGSTVTLSETTSVELCGSHTAWNPVTASSGEEEDRPNSTAQSKSDAEKVSLLDRSSTASATGTSASIESTHAWRLLGPPGGNRWSVQSSSLLQVTFRPAWQLLPEYTRVNAVRDKVGGGCCRSKACGRRHVDFVTDLYRTCDIESVEEVNDMWVRGVGTCRGLRLHLKARALEESIQPPPTLALRLALERQWNLPSNKNPYSRFSQDSDSLPQPPWKQEVPKQVSGPILTFAMPLEDQDHHRWEPVPLLHKVELPPNKNIAVETITVMNASLETDIGAQTPNFDPSHVYVNGFQSWSFCGSVAKGQPQPTSAMPNVFSAAFNRGGAAPPITHGDVLATEEVVDKDTYLRHPPADRTAQEGYKSEFFSCITSDASDSDVRENGAGPLMDQDGGPALIMGWLSQHFQFGVITMDAKLERIAMHASAEGGQLWKRGGCTDWGFVQLLSENDYEEEPMVDFLHAVAAFNQAKPLQNGSLLTGWCSWYHYYEKISETNLRDNFQRLKGLATQKVLATNVSIVDDGYMTAWGDWDSLKPEDFSHGLDVVSKDIRDNGMRPGLWLAPFACDKHSKLALKHPEWIICNDQGRYANSSNCGKFFYGLDATNPGVRGYVETCIRRAVEEWNYSVLKIDFLYSACLSGNGKYDLSISRAEAMHMALETVRHAAGRHTFLIGCGCPIGTAVGYIDGMRVSADTGPTWYPPFPFPKKDHGTLPALKSMIRNSMSRVSLGHRWWHNDPDCLLFGNSTKLNDTEVTSAASVVAMTCGMLLLSDDLTKLTEERQSILSKIYPMTGATAIPLDLHSTPNKGMPSLLRLWCTDRYDLTFDEDVHGSLVKSFHELSQRDHNAAATYFGRLASFNADEPWPLPNERKRNCICVASGMGTWTVLSLTNCHDVPTIMHAPLSSLHPPPETGWEEVSYDEVEPTKSQKRSTHGYHVFAFWSSTYTWIPDQDGPMHSRKDAGWSKLLDAHATEIIHIRPVSLNMPQYVGSDLHFSCGQEVNFFEATVSSVTVRLKTDWRRKGSIFLYLPRLDVDSVSVSVNGVSSSRKVGGWDVVANTPRHHDVPPPTCLGRIIEISVVIHADESKHDGEVVVEF